MLIGRGSIKAFGENPSIILILLSLTCCFLLWLLRKPEHFPIATKLSLHFLFHCLFMGTLNRVTSYDSVYVWALFIIAIISHVIIWSFFTKRISISKRNLLLIGSITIIFNLFKISKLNFSFPETNYDAPIIKPNVPFHPKQKNLPNILHIVLEKISSDEAINLIQSDKNLSSLFKEFTFYPNTVANYIFTKGSVGSFLTGDFMPDGASPEKFYQNSFIKKDALPSLLSKAGYEVNFVNSLYINKSPHINNFIDLRTRSPRNYSILFRSLVQFATYVHIAQQQYFPLGANYLTFFEFSKFQFIKERENLIHYLNRIEPTLRKKNRYTFLYYSRPHAPYFEKYDCSDSFLLRATEYTNSMKCSLSLIGDWLKKFSKTKAWEKTVILIHSDHGRLNDIAFPLFMIKQGQEIPIQKTNKLAIELVDILPTLLHIAEIDQNPAKPGQNILSANYREKMSRLAHYTLSQRSKLSKEVEHPNCLKKCSEGTIIKVSKDKILEKAGVYRIEATY